MQIIKKLAESRVIFTSDGKRITLFDDGYKIGLYFDEHHVFRLLELGNNMLVTTDRMDIVGINCRIVNFYKNGEEIATSLVDYNEENKNEED